MVPEKIKIEDYNLPIKEGVYYCLHNYKDIFKQNIKKGYLLNLQVYTNEAEKADIKLGPVTYYNSVSRTLYQPWGTNLLSDEFKKPIFRKNKLIFWIGSIWNDKNNAGNINEINQLKMACKKLGLKFIHLRFIPDWLNIFFVRLSRLAPAIEGKQQVDNNYLPCRMFKNISYGQLGITNVKKFKDILGESFVCGETILELLENASKLNQQEFLDLINKQQLIVKNYIYEQSLKNIIDCLGK
jgi:hypothetical protein